MLCHAVPGIEGLAHVPKVWPRIIQGLSIFVIYDIRVRNFFWTSAHYESVKIPHLIIMYIPIPHIPFVLYHPFVIDLADDDFFVVDSERYS